MTFAFNVLSPCIRLSILLRIIDSRIAVGVGGVGCKVERIVRSCYHRNCYHDHNDLHDLLMMKIVTNNLR